MVPESPPVTSSPASRAQPSTPLPPSPRLLKRTTQATRSRSGGPTSRDKRTPPPFNWPAVRRREPSRPSPYQTKLSAAHPHTRPRGNGHQTLPQRVLAGGRPRGARNNFAPQAGFEPATHGLGNRRSIP